MTFWEVCFDQQTFSDQIMLELFRPSVTLRTSKSHVGGGWTVLT